MQTRRKYTPTFFLAKDQESSLTSSRPISIRRISDLRAQYTQRAHQRGPQRNHTYKARGGGAHVPAPIS